MALFEIGTIVAVSTAAAKAPADDLLTYTVRFTHNGAAWTFSGVKPTAQSRPDPAIVDCQPFLVGEEVKVIGSIFNGNFHGVIERFVGERPAYGPCDA